MVPFGIYTRHDPRWKRGRNPLSLLGGFVNLVALIPWATPTLAGRANVPRWLVSIYTGGAERLIGLPLVIWLVAVGLQLVRGIEESAASSSGATHSS